MWNYKDFTKYVRIISAGSQWILCFYIFYWQHVYYMCKAYVARWFLYVGGISSKRIHLWPAGCMLFFLCVHFPAGWPVHGDAVHLLLPYQALNSRLLGLIWKTCPKEPQRCCFSCIKDELSIVKTFIMQLVLCAWVEHEICQLSFPMLLLHVALCWVCLESIDCWNDPLFLLQVFVSRFWTGRTT